MLLITHILAALLVLKLLMPLNILNVFLCVLGAVIPDIDILLHLKHRRITHSLIMLLFFPIKPLTIGILSHIFLDLLTPTGVMLFYPKNEWFVIFNAPLKTGKQDILLCIIMLGVILL